MDATMERLALPEVEGEIAEPHYVPLDKDQQQPLDPFETYCDAGREAAEHMDTGRWIIGDLALMVQKDYGRDKIGEFAKQINMKKARVQEYRTVCKYYPHDEREDFKEIHPTLTYTHFRAAKRYKDLKKSYDALEDAASKKEPLTPDEMEAKVAADLGKHVPPPAIVHEALVNLRDGGEERYIVLEVPDKQTWLNIMAALNSGRGNGLLMTLRPEEE